MRFLTGIKKQLYDFKQEFKHSDRKGRMDLLLRTTLLLATILGSAIIIIILIIILLTGIAPFLPHYEFGKISFIDFIFGMKWSPNTGIYGVGYMIINTLYVTFLTLLLIVPISILTALFIAKIAPRWMSQIMRSVIEILTSIPSIIFGLFGAAVIVKYVDIFANQVNRILAIFNMNPIETVAGLSTLSTVLVLSMMVFPTITSISETSIRSVSKDIEEASLALGATRTQTNFKVILTSAKSGIFAGIILGVGRALGEATAISLVAGNLAVGPSLGLFRPTQTLTTAMLIGIHESSGINYDIRFSIALVLMALILIVNAILNLVKQKVGNIDA